MRGMIAVRRPASTPSASTSGVTGSTGVTPSIGSTAIVAPRMSLPWKPWPAATKNSVSRHGPNTSDSFGLARSSLPEPELAARSLATS